MSKRSILAAAGTFLLTGCASTTLYAPLSVDPGTGLYPAVVHLTPADAQAFVTGEDPRAFRAVVLTVETNFRPANLAFMIRQALAQEGITRVYTMSEFARMAGLRSPPASATARPDMAAVQKYSRLTAPVLIVNFRFDMSAGHADTALKVSDDSNGHTLLEIDQRRLIWSNWDTESLFPVLNELRQWVKACPSEGA